MRNVFVVILAVLTAGLISGGICAQTYRIDWYSINSGGGLVTGGSYKLNSSVGQPVAGFVKSTSFLHWIGFWAGEVPTPTVAPTINAAKLLGDGTFVSVAGKIATSGRNPITGITDRFSGFFYLEEADRHSGIRISCPSWPITDLLRGSVINVIGTMGTTGAGERQIVAPIVIITSTTTPPPPLGMNNRAVGGAAFGSPPLGQSGVIGGTGLNNIGLLIKTWGEVTYKEPSGAYILITDGAGAPVRIDTAGLASVPSEGYVSVIGISSLYTGPSPLVLPRTDSDIEPR